MMIILPTVIPIRISIKGRIQKQGKGTNTSKEHEYKCQGSCRLLHGGEDPVIGTVDEDAWSSLLFRVMGLCVDVFVEVNPTLDGKSISLKHSSNIDAADELSSSDIDVSVE